MRVHLFQANVSRLALPFAYPLDAGQLRPSALEPGLPDGGALTGRSGFLYLFPTFCV
jgi:hypothetical protein